MEKVRYLNGYRLLFKPENPRSMKSDNWGGWIYEHVYLGEKIIGRPLNDNEVVHHLDGDRSNNRIENLLVLERSQHTKLHEWLNRGAPYDESLRVDRVNSGKSKVSYCEVCSNTLQAKQKKFCSVKCQGIANRKTQRPSKEELEMLLESNSLVSIGKIFGVSDNAVRKWAKKYNLL